MQNFEDGLSQEGLRRTDSGYVEWSKEHREYPRNWSVKRKAYDISVIIFFEFYSTLISTTGPSAASHAVKEFHISRTVSLVAFNLV
jgi:hypothetical protein